MVKSNILNQYIEIYKDALSELETKSNKIFKDFIVETFLVYMIIPQRIYYLQPGIYSYSYEQCFRMNSALGVLQVKENDQSYMITKLILPT
jgi:hypothetical protein